ncbi:MAG: hypothetical protein QOK37_341 [Thermoanaerobaculia bacterium]|jgi:hypothetical protein|nr:hypothetical protein [Thermoanaerobaculia bacterium]
MRSAASAIAWEFRARHRWGLMALAGYLIVLVAVKLLVLLASWRVDLRDESFGLLIMGPLAATFMYLLAMFTFGLSGDLAARQSMYPARTFTLPVTSATLVAWPMIYGTAAVAILWLVTRMFALWPSGVVIPVFWPALLAASLLAWTQALTWMSYPLRGLRVIVTVLWLTIIDSVVLVALQFKPPEAVMLAILAPHVPLAYLAACFAVARARRGDIPDWQGLFAPRARIADVHTRQKGFSSAARAQEWFEWRRHGRSLPALIAILLPFELAMLFIFRETPVIIIETLITVLVTPPFMAAFTAATVSNDNPERRSSDGLTPFLATRPMTGNRLIAAKLSMAMRSTLAAWALVLIAIPSALTLSKTWPVITDLSQQLADIVGRPRAIVIGLLILAGFVASTWKQLVQNLYIGMTGREGLIKGSVFVALAVLCVAAPLGHWIITHGEARAALWRALPWIGAVLVAVKLSAAIRVAARLLDRGLFHARTIVIAAVCWDCAVFVLFGVLAWVLPALFVPRFLLIIVAILAMPLVRIAAAPLALAWNRHR